MSHGADKHMEHAEHAQHAAHSPFDRGVAMSIAIMAAALAGVTLLSHRGHTEVLRLANEANIYHTKKSDQYSFYQAKNIRSYEFQSFLMLSKMLAKDRDVDLKFVAQAQKIWIKQVNKYEGDVSKGKDEKPYWTLMDLYLQGKEKDRPKRFDAKHSELTAMLQEAKDLEDKANTFEHASHELHEHVNWIDYGHLALELGIVFASIGVLTRSRPFWFTGIAVGVLGLGLAGYGWVGELSMKPLPAAHATPADGDHSGDGHKESGKKDSKSSGH